MIGKTARTCAGVIALVATLAQGAWAAYPEKPVRIVVGFAAGGPTDVVARIIADHLAKANGKPFVVDNKQALESPEVRQRLQALGMQPMGTSLKDFDAQIAREVDTFGRIAKARGITGDD